MSLPDPRPDAECVDTDTNQVCGNKAKLRGAKADYANDHAVDDGYQKSRPRSPSEEDSRQYGEKTRDVI